MSMGNIREEETLKVVEREESNSCGNADNNRKTSGDINGSSARNGRSPDMDNEYLLTILDSLPKGIFCIDSEGVCTFCNSACAAMLGYEEESALIGNNMHLKLHNHNFQQSLKEAEVNAEREDNAFCNCEICGMIKASADDKRTHSSEHVFWRADGTELVVEYFSYPQYNGDKIVGTVVTFYDITDRKIWERQKARSEFRDALTGVFNRLYFEREIAKLDVQENLPISVIMGDINDLKKVNSEYGRLTGDMIIVETARILSNCCTGNHIIARTGDDEFTILLPRTDNESAYMFCEAIKADISRYNNSVSDKSFTINISLGYSTKERIDRNINEVLRMAENLMYRYKLLDKRSIYGYISSAMKTTAEDRNQNVNEHAERLMIFSKMFSIYQNIPAKDAYNLLLFALMHDIGKAGIEDFVLNKKSRLDEGDWLEIKKHPEIGYRIAMSLPELMPIADYILYHQERWDGKGYPKGLAGEQIPYLCRVLAVIDAYDAMTHDRIYRKAISTKAALREIKKNAGKQFDPQVAEAFIKMLMEMPDIKTACVVEEASMRPPA